MYTHTYIYNLSSNSTCKNLLPKIKNVYKDLAIRITFSIVKMVLSVPFMDHQGGHEVKIIFIIILILQYKSIDGCNSGPWHKSRQWHYVLHCHTRGFT